MTEYETKPGARYGSTFKDRRPPGLPFEARPTSTREAGLKILAHHLDANGVTGALRSALEEMAKKESGAQLGRPTGTFDARIKVRGQDGPPHYYGTAVDGLRPSGGIVTAWGIFQFNRDAWRALPGVSNSAFPWDASIEEEIGRPLAVYVSLWNDARTAGADEVSAARYVHLWQHGSSYSNRFKSGAAKLGGDASAWAQAWLDVPADHRNVIDKHLRNAGVL